MTFPVYTIAQLASTTGRPAESYRPWADEAIKQASVLFQIHSCVSEPPSEVLPAALMEYGVLYMADAIYLSQPWQEAKASPFQAETIGSYSYSRLMEKARNGEDTGIEFYDLAVEHLGQCHLHDDSRFGSGGIEVFEYKGVFTHGLRPGNIQYISPAQVASAYGRPLLAQGVEGGGQGSDNGNPPFFGEGWEVDPQNPGYLEWEGS